MKVLGTELFDQGMEKAVMLFLEELQHPPKNKCISPSDANVLVEALRNPDFAKILRSYYWNLPDGVPSVWMLRRKGAKRASRCAGPDFFETIIKNTRSKSVNHFLLGGEQGVADELKQRCAVWGNSKITGIFSPPYAHHKDMDYKKMADLVLQANTDVLWIGLGAPKQIYVAHELAKHIQVKFIITVGAAFDFHTGRVKKAPKWLQKIGMEWFFRMCTEPRRLVKRYFKVVPLFLFYGFLDLFRK